MNDENVEMKLVLTSEIRSKAPLYGIARVVEMLDDQYMAGKLVDDIYTARCKAQLGFFDVRMNVLNMSKNAVESFFKDNNVSPAAETRLLKEKVPITLKYQTASTGSSAKSLFSLGAALTGCLDICEIYDTKEQIFGALETCVLLINKCHEIPLNWPPSEKIKEWFVKIQPLSPAYQFLPEESAQLKLDLSSLHSNIESLIH